MATCFIGDFLSIKNDYNFDIIIGNPPYNSGNLIKTPTNTILKKKNDGRTIWPDFIRRSLSILTEGGYLLFITPSIWMKPDKQGIYNILKLYQLEKIHCLTNTETNKVFNGHAQTPTCFFLLNKIPSMDKTLLFDKNIDSYVNYFLREQKPIPVFGQSIIAKLQYFVDNFGSENNLISNRVA